MGRATEYFDYITRDLEPDAETKEALYFSLNVNKYKKLRKHLAMWRKRKRKGMFYGRVYSEITMRGRK